MNSVTPRHTVVFALCFSATVLLVAVPPASSAPAYQLTDLGAEFIPYRISDAGQIVGGGPRPGYGPALVWQDGALTDLGVGVAQDINANGQIVISIPVPGVGTPAPNVWQNGVVTPLPILPWGGDFRHYYAMNSAGHVVGQAAERAFLWDGALNYLDLGDTGPFSSSYAINDANQIVGNTGNGGFLWDAGLVTTLPDIPMDINDLSQVLLLTSIWDDGAVTPLGRLPLLPGSDESGCCGPTVRGQAINNLGQVVGNQTDFYLVDEEHGFSARYRTFLRDPSGNMWDLAELLGASDFDWTFAWASDINDAGQIVGYSGNRGFLLSPVPEPASVALAIIGLAALATFARRVRSNRCSE